MSSADGSPRRGPSTRGLSIKVQHRLKADFRRIQREGPFSLSGSVYDAKANFV